jgi:nucleoside-triphosphatase THEP1
MVPPSLILLSAERNTGKTTALRRWVEEWKQSGLSVRGVLSIGVMRDGHKTGFDFHDIEDGDVFEAIRTVDAGRGDLDCGFSFDREAFATLTNRYLNRGGCDLMVIDEVGPFELRHHDGFLPVVEHYLQRTAIPLLIVVRPWCLHELVTMVDELLMKSGGGLIAGTAGTDLE